MPIGIYDHNNTLKQNPGLLDQMREMRKTMTYQQIADQVHFSTAWVGVQLGPFEPKRGCGRRGSYRRTESRMLTLAPSFKEFLAQKEQSRSKDWELRHPCGAGKDVWRICFETRCLNKWGCGAFEKGKRRGNG